MKNSVAKEKTLVLIKPDGVARSLIGEIITRFERTGLKIVGMKMVYADEEIAKKHYTEDIERRYGRHIRNYNIEYIASGPMIAIVIEGINAISNIRKICGTTEPKSAVPGTIRGDFCHVSCVHCNDNELATKNIVHASGNKKEAEAETKLWFKPEEIHEYENVHEIHTHGYPLKK